MNFPCFRQFYKSPNTVLLVTDFSSCPPFLQVLFCNFIGGALASQVASINSLQFYYSTQRQMQMTLFSWIGIIEARAKTEQRL